MVIGMRRRKKCKSMNRGANPPNKKQVCLTGTRNQNYLTKSLNVWELNLDLKESQNRRGNLIGVSVTTNRRQGTPLR